MNCCSGFGKIRKAALSDMDAVYGFLCDLEGEKLDYAGFSAVFTENLSNPKVHYFVLQKDEEIAGFISLHIQRLLHHTAPIGEIQELYISPEVRGEGMGRRLVETAVNKARESGCKQVEVCCNQKRLKTHKFYEHIGFMNTHFKFCK